MTTGIKQIAEAAGVSPSTVSRALNNPSVVNKATLAKVLATIKELNYQPNHFASNLRNRRATNILLALPKVSNPFNELLIQTIENEASRLGYNLIITNIDNDAHVRQIASMARSGQIDGILLFAPISPFAEGESPVPIVNACEDILDQNMPGVFSDNINAAKQVMDHLIRQGHTRIAAVTGPDSYSTSLERTEGYRSALQDAQLIVNEELIINSDFSLDGGYAATVELLQLNQRPSAIFYFNDDMAIGGISALADNGVQVPSDIAVIGFDDIKYAAHTSPALTTIRQPREAIAKLAMTLLHKIILGDAISDTRHMFKCELIIRESCS